MFDTLLKTGAKLDWITPTLAFFQDICNGPVVHIACPAEQGWSAVQVKEMLTRVGVKVWGLMAVDDSVVFSVRQAQARYALYWLEREGIAYESSFHAAAPHVARPAQRQVKDTRRPQPRRSRGLDGLLDGIVNFADKL